MLAFSYQNEVGVHASFGFFSSWDLEILQAAGVCGLKRPVSERGWSHAWVKPKPEKLNHGMWSISIELAAQEWMTISLKCETGKELYWNQLSPWIYKRYHPFT